MTALNDKILYLYDVISKNFSLQAISAPHYMQPHVIDNLAMLETKRSLAHHQEAEENYVKDMLLENPVIVERRSNNSIHGSDTSLGDNVFATKQEQEQRSESCRKSRINNKIKKAKNKLRHKYRCQELMQMMNFDKNIHDIISETEQQLIASGRCNKDSLLKMRQAIGVKIGEVNQSNQELVDFIQVD